MSADKKKDEAEDPAGPGNKNKPKGAQNPPADFGGEDVVEAKKHVSPQNVGAYLADADALKAVDPKSDEATPAQKVAAEQASTDAYMKDHAPIDNPHEEPMRNADVDEDTGGSTLKDAKN